MDMPCPSKPLPLSSYPLDLPGALAAVEKQREQDGSTDVEQDEPATAKNGLQK
jgi:hypothetical protein